MNQTAQVDERHLDSREQAEPDAPPMPEMREGLLSAEDLNLLCADLTQLTQILSIQTRERGNTNARAATCPLNDLLPDLWAAKLQAVQIRYAWDGHEWTDTLMRIPPHVRVVRCQHPPA